MKLENIIIYTNEIVFKNKNEIVFLRIKTYLGWMCVFE